MNIRIIILFILFIILFSACSKKDDEQLHTKSELEINAFIAESISKSDETTPILKGVNATFYAMLPGGKTITEKGNYIASSSGLMTGLDNYIMYLIPGNYEIYGLSENSENIFPALNNLTTQPLKNGVDYLWSGNVPAKINNIKTSLNVTFQHIASNLIFELESSSNLKINQIDSVLLQTPQEGATFTITNPVIDQAINFSNSFTEMIISGLRCSYIILPVKDSKSFNTYFYITFNNQSKTTPYSLTITPPTGGYLSGKSYNYKISITETELIIKAFTVSDWIVNDFTDQPIYPEN